MSRRPILVLIPGHWVEAGVLYFNNRGNRPNAVSSANVQGSAQAHSVNSNILVLTISELQLRYSTPLIPDPLALFRRYLVSVRGGELELQPSTKR